MKKIDIIIPVYKAKDTLPKTLASIVMQTISNQCIVTLVNDCDGLDYSEIIKSYEHFLDIKEITLKKNGGPGVARQSGLENTKLPYITFIDADDVFYSAFSLNALLKTIENNDGYHTVVGSFLEEHPNDKFLNHSNDMIWVFGKLYTRQFLNKYHISFNDTRANEDNGFNTKIRLCSSPEEKIYFLKDIVYVWKYKEDSITRINNFEYTYNQSFTGYAVNMIDAIQHAKKVKPFNGYIDMWAIETMPRLYNYYLQTEERDKRFIEQNFKSCVKYYEEIYQEVSKKYDDKTISHIVSKVLVEQSKSMEGIVPSITYNDFVKKLKEAQE